MRVAVVGTKGGVGKSIIAAALAKVLSFPLVDADVEAPNAAIYLKAKGKKLLREVEKEVAVALPGAGACSCPFGAIKIASDGEFYVDPRKCKFCGLCHEFCNGYGKERVVYGRIYEYTAELPLIGAELLPGFCGSGQIVNELLTLASGRWEDFVIDCAAGLGCKVISALKFADAAVLVTEKTTLRLIPKFEEVLKNFGISYLTVFNFSSAPEGDFDFYLKKDPKLFFRLGKAEIYPWEVPELKELAEKIAKKISVKI